VVAPALTLALSQQGLFVPELPLLSQFVAATQESRGNRGEGKDAAGGASLIRWESVASKIVA
jgi:hypothetical protein